MRRAAVLLVVVAGLLAPSTAGASTATALFGKAAGPNGLRVSWYASNDALDRNHVRLSIVFDRTSGAFPKTGFFDESQSYSFTVPKRALRVDAPLRHGRLVASLGSFGSVNIRFHRSGIVHVEPADSVTCTDRTASGKMRIEGSIAFAPAALGAVGRLRSRGIALRATGRGDCTTADTPTTCDSKPGEELMDASAFTGYTGVGPSFSAYRSRRGGPVTQSFEAFEPLAAPGTQIQRELSVIGPGGLMHHSGSTVTVEAAGHGLTGTLTVIGNVRHGRAERPCKHLRENSISEATAKVAGSVTAGFTSGAISIDAAVPGSTISGSWSLYHR